MDCTDVTPSGERGTRRSSGMVMRGVDDHEKGTMIFEDSFRVGVTRRAPWSGTSEQ